jgi:hypothetical protein
MMTLNPVLRKLILENIPEFTNEDLDRYESLLALRLELSEQKSVVPIQVLIGNNDPDRTQEFDYPRARITTLIARTSAEAAGIVTPGYQKFQDVHQLWLARRRLALHQGGLLQIPSTWDKLAGLVKATCYDFWVQLKTFPRRTKDRVNSFFKRQSTIRVLIISGMTVLFLVAIRLLALKEVNEVEKISQPQQNNTAIADTTTQLQPVNR